MREGRTGGHVEGVEGRGGGRGRERAQSSGKGKYTHKVLSLKKWEGVKNKMNPSSR